MAQLTPGALNDALAELKGWSLENGELTKEFKFADFAAALEFVNQAGALAEAAQHHPDIDIRYNKVRIALVTHDEGGITGKDTDMAGQIETVSKGQ